MNEDVFNGSIRKFLKTLGVSAQREIEKAVYGAIESGAITGAETLPVEATLVIDGLPMRLHVHGDIALERPSRSSEPAE